MIKKRDFILVGLQPWDIKIGSNFKNFAYEIAKENRVLYVNLPLNTKSRILNLYKGQRDQSMQKRSDLVSINKNLFVYTPSVANFSINWLSKGFLYNALNKRNAQAYASGILKMIDQLNFRNYFLINDSLMFIGKYLKEMLHPELYVYYIRDYLVQQPYFKRHGSYLEPEAFKSSDIVIANSDYLADYARQFNPQSYMIGQGCHIESFTQEGISPVRLDLPPEKPVVGYVGSLSSKRLDIPLLEFISEKMPDWQLVFVGPEDVNFRNSTLHNRSNVHFAGLKPMEELPAWIKRFDVCLNPQLVNELTIGNYPRKIDEYLAMGKPVVATETLAMEYFRKYVYLAKGKEEYIELIKKALQEDHEERQKSRVEYAKSHSWSNNVQAIYELIQRHSPATLVER